MKNKFKGVVAAVVACVMVISVGAFFTACGNREDNQGPTTYTLSYIAGTGGTITGVTSQTVQTGNDGTAVTAVANSGYEFEGWSDGIATAQRQDTNITANLSVTAQFKHVANLTYTIVWRSQDGLTVLKTDTDVAHGSIPIYSGVIPTKEQTEQYKYSYAGWATTADQEEGLLDNQLPAMTANITYYVAFSKALRTYTATWENYNGTTLKEQEYQYGETPSYGETAPTRDVKHGFSFAFDKFTPNATAITGDTVYTANFNVVATNITLNNNMTLAEQEVFYYYRLSPVITGQYRLLGSYFGINSSILNRYTISLYDDNIDLIEDLIPSEDLIMILEAGKTYYIKIKFDWTNNSTFTVSHVNVITFHNNIDSTTTKHYIRHDTALNIYSFTNKTNFNLTNLSMDPEGNVAYTNARITENTDIYLFYDPAYEIDLNQPFSNPGNLSQYTSYVYYKVSNNTSNARFRIKATNWSPGSSSFSFEIDSSNARIYYNQLYTDVTKSNDFYLRFDRGFQHTLAVFNGYDVSFNTNGGSSVYTRTVYHGETIGSLSNPTKTLSTFAGWFKDPGLTQPFTVSTDTITENTTLYAKWTTNAKTSSNTLELNQAKNISYTTYGQSYFVDINSAGTYKINISGVNSPSVVLYNYAIGIYDLHSGETIKLQYFGDTDDTSFEFDITDTSSDYYLSIFYSHTLTLTLTLTSL